jgi:hypothetical protein
MFGDLLCINMTVIDTRPCIAGSSNRGAYRGKMMEQNTSGRQEAAEALIERARALAPVLA